MSVDVNVVDSIVRGLIAKKLSFLAIDFDRTLCEVHTGMPIIFFKNNFHSNKIMYNRFSR